MTYKTPGQLSYELQELKNEVARLAELIVDVAYGHSHQDKQDEMLAELDLSMTKVMEAVEAKELEIKQYKKEEEFLEGMQRERILEELQRRDGTR